MNHKNREKFPEDQNYGINFILLRHKFVKGDEMRVAKIG